MKIAIIGSGLMGRALGVVWAKAGHRVAFSFSHDSAKLDALAKEAGHEARASTVDVAVRDADAIFVAVSLGSLNEALHQAGSLAQRTVLTCLIPMNDDDSEMAIGQTWSGAEEVAKRSRANVVAIFDTIPSELIADREMVMRESPDVLYCGDDGGAKQTAAALATSAGFTPIDAGPLRVARYLEPFELAIANLAYDQELGPNLGYRIVSPRVK